MLFLPISVNNVLKWLPEATDSFLLPGFVNLIGNSLRKPSCKGQLTYG